MKQVQGLRYLWKIPENPTNFIYQNASRYNLSIPVVHVLHTRGVIHAEHINDFLISDHEKNVADPKLLKDAEKSVKRILHAIEQKEKILISGDYDVDGITSTALLIACLAPLGAKINYFLPHRIHDGYGLSKKTVQKAIENKYQLLITVDNGITAFSAVEEAKGKNIDIIITDHHRPHEHLPEAFAIIDPHQKDCPYPFKFFAGVGVSFKLMSLLYEYLGKELPEKVYELLLLGTVADVVPLTGENRFWVQHGIATINNNESFSLSILKKNGGCTEKILTASDIAFYITPQINALGRLDDPRAGVKFLLGDNRETTIATGDLLATLNQQRKLIEKQIFAEIVAYIKTQVNLTIEKIIIVAHTEWSPGIIGLVASRIAQTYHRPTIIFHIGSDNISKGSCRSIQGINIFEALTAAQDLLNNFGGHPMAAGLSLKTDNIPFLKERLQKYMEDMIDPINFIPKLIIDAPLSLPETTKKLFSDLARLEPFGCENPQPKFYIAAVSLVGKPQLLKNAHTKCLIFADGIIKPIIFFQRPDIYEFLITAENMLFDCVVQVVKQSWQNKDSIEFHGVDISYTQQHNILNKP